MKTIYSAVAIAAGFALASAGQARADATIDLTGTDSNAGAIDLTTAGGSFGGPIVVNGVTGYSLWGLLGGATGATNSAVSGGTQTTNGGIVNFTPTGDNSKNAILRDYLIVTDGAGNKSIVSLGEIDPNFVGATASSDFLLSVSGSTVSFDDVAAGAAGRDLTGVSSIQLLSVPALPGPITPAPQSPYVTLSGSVTNPGNYGTASGTIPFTAHTPQVLESVNGDNYTGVALWDFLGQSYSSSLDQYVISAGTDGYEVVLSLAELDPSLGGNPGDADLLPFADTTGNFPSSGVARTILPGDTAFAHGRWESDLIELDVVTVPEPGSLALVASGLAFVALRRKRRQV